MHCTSPEQNGRDRRLVQPAVPAAGADPNGHDADVLLAVPPAVGGVGLQAELEAAVCDRPHRGLRCPLIVVRLCDAGGGLAAARCSNCMPRRRDVTAQPGQPGARHTGARDHETRHRQEGAHWERHRTCSCARTTGGAPNEPRLTVSQPSELLVPFARNFEACKQRRGRWRCLTLAESGGRAEWGRSGAMQGLFNGIVETNGSRVKCGCCAAWPPTWTVPPPTTVLYTPTSIVIQSTASDT